MIKKKPDEADEMQMPAEEFDAIMREALGVPPPARPAQEGKDRGKKGEKKRPKKS